MKPEPNRRRTESPTQSGFASDEETGIRRVPESLRQDATPTNFGPYSIFRELGTGGMAIVYLAQQEGSDEVVALKVPAARFVQDEQIIKRFMREATVAAKICHPNVCQIYDTGETDGIPYYSMAYIDGVDLAKWIQQQDELTTEQALKISRDIALGLQAAHEAGVIHRDLKPSNIMMTSDARPVILDFGMLRVMDSDHTMLTPTGAMVGTPAYMSPEQVLAQNDKIGPSSDIYSLGVILYEMLGGFPPFSGSLATMLGTIINDPPPPLMSHNNDLPPDLDSICQKALAKTPEERFASAKDFADAVDCYLEHGEVQVPNDSAPATKTGGWLRALNPFRRS